MYKVKVENVEQLDVAISHKDVNSIILSRDCFAESDILKYVNKIKKVKKQAWILMERISRYEELIKPLNLRLSTDQIFNISNLDGIIVQNIDSFAYVIRKINKVANAKLLVELNCTMNCYNNETKKVYTEIYNEKRNNAKDVPLRFTSPVELNLYELSDVGYDTIILYAYIDTMVAANCLRKNLHKDIKELCKYKFNFDKVNNYLSYIIDRKRKKLYYKCYCKYCYNKLFNTEPLYLLDKINEFSKYMNNNKIEYRIDFSIENGKEVLDILNRKIPFSFTRGHYKKTIQ